jgi:hypothetical protein
MKKTACVVLILAMVMFLVNPLSIAATGGSWGGGHSGGGHSGGSWGGSHGGSGHGGGYWGGGHGDGYHHGWGSYWDWWAPWVVGAAILAPFFYAPYYYGPPPVVIREQPPVNVPPYSPVPQPLPSENFFIYPRNGQSEELLTKDRYECHSWAVSQTHFDPTQPFNGMTEAQLNQMRANYQRAIAACLDGRGYTMK